MCLVTIDFPVVPTKSFSVWLLIVSSGLVLTGCGPDLTRPGWKPPKALPEKSASAKFLEAQAALLSSMRFHFDYVNYRPLSSVKKEISKVVAKYPPRMVGGSPDVTSLEIDRVTDAEFKRFLQAAGFQPRDIECARDYTEMCPPRWADLGDGETCEPPPGLFSDCQPIKFGGMTPLQKSAAAFACAETVFPCVDECLTRDYSRTCPENWRLIKGTTKCRAPDDYVKPCIKVYDFADHSALLKRKFEKICKVNWKCKKSVGVLKLHV